MGTPDSPVRRRMRLGKREIDALSCPPGRRDVMVFDAELPGFGVRVTDTGRKVFLFQYRLGSGAVRRLTLGDYGAMTPAQARAAAEQARAQARGGGDPVADRREKNRSTLAAEAAARKQSEADALTFGALVERWASIGLRDRRPSYRTEARRALLVNLAKLKEKPAHAIDAAGAQRALDGISEDRGPVMARRSLAYARAMFGWATRRGLVPMNPFSGRVTEGRDVPRDRCLSDAELGAVWRASAGLGFPYGPWVRVLLLTLQREGEVAGMRWAELAADLSTWTVPAERAKNGKAHLVHLAEPVRAELRRIPRPKGAELVFSTTGKTPISGFSNAKERLLRMMAKEAAEAADTTTDEGEAPPEPPAWRFHDFRRTGVTALAQEGVAPHVADRLLNHVQGTIHGVAAIYQRHEFLPEREAALRTWARYVLRVATVPDRQAQASNVLLLPVRPR